MGNESSIAVLGKILQTLYDNRIEFIDAVTISRTSGLSISTVYKKLDGMNGLVTLKYILNDAGKRTKLYKMEKTLASVIESSIKQYSYNPLKVLLDSNAPLDNQG